jgi:hypothetical protein
MAGHKMGHHHMWALSALQLPSLKNKFLLRGLHTYQKGKLTSHGCKIELPEQATLHSLSLNKNDGFYNHRVELGIEKKLRVVVSYQCCKETKGGLRPNLPQVARDCNHVPPSQHCQNVCQVQNIVIYI